MDEIASRAPVDKTAALVVSKGFTYVPNIKNNQRHWEICPPDIKRELPPGMLKKDFLVGCKFGRFVVVGLYTKKNRRYALWVCRCACGHYETRTAKAIRNESNAEDSCEFCKHLNHLKQRGKYRNQRSKSDE